jgi:hypothetical protein
VRFQRFHLWLGAGAVAVAGLIVVLVIALPAGASDVNTAQLKGTMAAAGCSYRETPASASALHMQGENQKVTYSTFPPTSGVHYPVPARWGNYSTTADPRQVVHNLEHGGVVIWYGPDVPPAERQKITVFYDGDPNGIIVTPLVEPVRFVTFPKHERLGSRIALTAWAAKVKQEDGSAQARGAVAICPRFDESAFAAFRDTLRGKGPEPYSVKDLMPGGQ